MYVHAFMFQWKVGIADRQRNDAMRQIQSLAGKIPGLVELTCGENVSPRSQGFTHGGVMKFSDKNSLDAYDKHPEHQKVLALLKPMLSLAAELDYEIE
jgi:hypothetical protein